MSTGWRGCGPQGDGPAPARGGEEADRSGVLGEAPLAGPAVRRVAERGQGLVGAAPVLVELVDLAGFLAGRHLAAELAGDADQLADGVGRRALLAQLAPEGVLVATAGV